MNPNQMLAKIAATVSTLAETEGASESALYLTVCGCDMSTWETLRSVLLGSSLVSIKSHFVTLTPKGKEIGDKINARLAASK